MNPPAESNRLQVSRFIKASPRRVFRAWTSPVALRHWFGPATCQVLEVELDLRVGGAYRIRVLNDPGNGTPAEEIEVRGEYREISEPTKLVFTWKWADDEDWKKVDSLVTVDFLEKEGGTEVRITHEGLPDAESAGNHTKGWSGSLEKLAARATLMAEFHGPGQFAWNELLAADVKGSEAFYTQLLGWTTTAMDVGMPYTIFVKDGSEVGGMMQRPMEGMPPHWLSYISVEDCDATVARLRELGGEVLKEAFDIPGVGRIAIVRDPQGATFGLFQPKRE